MGASHTDIRKDDWVERALPSFLRPYARLMRLDRPIGVWLLLLPCWWGLTLAQGGGVPAPVPFFLFAVGAVVMRGAGCALNDVYDRRLDALVARTATRPLPCGSVTVKQALLFTAVLLLLGLAVLLCFNAYTIALGTASLALVFTYPLAKRVTWWPQLVLGLAFNWGALMGWTSVHGALGGAPVLLYLAGIFWTLGYDTIYAHQDREDDAKAGVKSLALRLGRRAPLAIAVFYALFFFFLTATGVAAQAHAAFFVGLLVAELHAFRLLSLWKPEEPASSLRAFQRNRDLGLIVWLSCVVAAF